MTYNCNNLCDHMNDLYHFPGECDCCSMRQIACRVLWHSKANICNVEFTSGQSLSGDAYNTCGSVVTCMIGGRSWYGKVVRFFSVLCDRNKNLYAYIQWMNTPDYPFLGTPLVVRVKDDSPHPRQLPNVVSIFDIDPSRVIIERDDVERCYYMCRIEGYDTVGTPTN